MFTIIEPVNSRQETWGKKGVAGSYMNIGTLPAEGISGAIKLCIDGEDSDGNCLKDPAGDFTNEVNNYKTRNCQRKHPLSLK